MGMGQKITDTIKLPWSIWKSRKDEENAEKEQKGYVDQDR